MFGMFLCCTVNMFGPRFAPHEILRKLRDFNGQLFFLFLMEFPFFLTIVFANFLTFLAEYTFMLLRTFAAWPWVSEICRGCQEFWCGCSLGSVGVLTPTVEYNSPPMRIMNKVDDKERENHYIIE